MTESNRLPEGDQSGCPPTHLCKETSHPLASIVRMSRVYLDTIEVFSLAIRILASFPGQFFQFSFSGNEARNN